MGQRMQLAGELDPRVKEYFPGLHGRQELSDDAAEMEE